MSSSSKKTGGVHDLGIFKLSDSCLLKISEGDISQWFINGSSDAIVNPATEDLAKSGRDEDGAIHKAAGPELRNACKEFPKLRRKCRCPIGEARITPYYTVSIYTSMYNLSITCNQHIMYIIHTHTNVLKPCSGFKLPVSHVIHAVGPERRAAGPGGDPEAEASLRSAYRNSMRLAKENNIHYIAFPGISTIKESFVRFPFEEAAAIALSTVKEQANDFKEIVIEEQSDGNDDDDAPVTWID
ncbi:hypothetical protein LWI29_033712 [Acer saccharum]|uniref:Macro domain-containing protein n=1 Tax=Acer saccharum TaxID=4024 RepID=A0AA39SFA2_ACESA|nr:hypothetical protein LWI29_033712 [Acer saccharum]